MTDDDSPAVEFSRRGLVPGRRASHAGVLAITFFCGALLLTAGLHAAADGTTPSPPAAVHTVFIGQPLRPEDEGQWAEVEGVVSFVGRQGEEIDLELSSGAGHMRVTVAKGGADLAELLPKCRIRARGRCVGVQNSVNGGTGAALAVPGPEGITILQAPQETWQRVPLRTAEASAQAATNSASSIIRLRGKLDTTNADGTYSLADDTGKVRLRLTQPPPTPGTEIELLGIVEQEQGHAVVEGEILRVITKGGNASSALPVLTTTEQVRWLKPGEARRRYPVKVRAVVTFLFGPRDEAVGNLQDGTGGIYAWHLVASGAAVRSGDYCEIEGDTSAGEFSPGIYCHKLKVLGHGALPEPIRPTWDELASGSLDAQWVEIPGIVLAATNQHLVIGAQRGRVVCFVNEDADLARFVDAVVRVRGVVVADWDQARHVTGLHLNVMSGEFVSIETPPPADPFALPAKPVKDLLFYDPGESAFRREKITGEIIGSRAGVQYLMNGTNGLRLLPKDNAQFPAGSLVEAVGFPEIDNSTAPPVLSLREAVVRTTGRAPLPPARTVAAEDPVSSENDACLVTVEARLVREGLYGADQVIEAQAGARAFFARLSTVSGRIPPLPAGSRVELTGVYVLNNDKLNEPAQSGPFELLLNSPAGLRVLELPSWWTSRHALMVVSGMAVVMLLGVIWIGLLRQQVDRRTAQLSTANRSLAAEIVERQRTENELVQTRLQHLVEQERTRIARDIHDELGSTLSQIRLLSEMTLAGDNAPVETRPNAEKISAKALEATHVLDEIVWAVDPQNDTLENTLNYLFNFASGHLSLAGIRFRIDAPTKMPHHVLTAPVRHQLYMAFKETLTNIVNHARATEVWIRLRLENGAACFLIEDNGRGFDLSGGAGGSPGASGLDNLRQRFGEIGSEFSVESEAGKGTRVKFVLPLNEPATT